MAIDDPFVEENRRLLKERSDLGFSKYGTNLTREDLSDEQWVQHAIEETLDLANYLQRIKSILNKKKNNA